MNLVLGLEPTQLLDLELAHEIRAEADEDAGRGRELDCVLAGLQHFGVLPEGDLRHPHVAPPLGHRQVGHQRGDEDRLTLGHELGGLVVEEVAMLNAAHPVSHCMDDRLW